MDVWIFCFLFFGVGCILFAFWLEQRKSDRLETIVNLQHLVGLCYVSDVRTAKSGGLELALKTNHGKFWYPVPACREDYLDLAKSKGRFVSASLGQDCGLRFEFVFEFTDSLQVHINAVGAALAEAASEWPLGGNTYQEGLYTLAGVELPLDQERVLRALDQWQWKLEKLPPLAEDLAHAKLGLKRQKLFARHSRLASGN